MLDVVGTIARESVAEPSQQPPAVVASEGTDILENEHNRPRPRDVGDGVLNQDPSAAQVTPTLTTAQLRERLTREPADQDVTTSLPALPKTNVARELTVGMVAHQELDRTRVDLKRRVPCNRKAKSMQREATHVHAGKVTAVMQAVSPGGRRGVREQSTTGPARSSLGALVAAEIRTRVTEQSPTQAATPRHRSLKTGQPI